VVKDQGDYWQVVSTAGWDNKYWKQSIVPIRGDGSFASAISTNSMTVDGKPVPLGEFHAKLRDLTDRPLKKNMMFPGLADKYNPEQSQGATDCFRGGRRATADRCFAAKDVP